MTRLLFVLVLVLNSAALLLSVLALEEIQGSTRVNCRKVEAVKEQIVDSLKASLKAPVPVYYKAHPSELLKAVEHTRHEIGRFKPKPC